MRLIWHIFTLYFSRNSTVHFTPSFKIYISLSKTNKKTLFLVLVSRNIITMRRKKKKTMDTWTWHEKLPPRFYLTLFNSVWHIHNFKTFLFFFSFQKYWAEKLREKDPCASWSLEQGRAKPISSRSQCPLWHHKGSTSRPQSISETIETWTFLSFLRGAQLLSENSEYLNIQKRVNLYRTCFIWFILFPNWIQTRPALASHERVPSASTTGNKLHGGKRAGDAEVRNRHTEKWDTRRLLPPPKGTVSLSCFLVFVFFFCLYQFRCALSATSSYTKLLQLTLRQSTRRVHTPPALEEHRQNQTTRLDFTFSSNTHRSLGLTTETWNRPPSSDFPSELMAVGLMAWEFTFGTESLCYLTLLSVTSRSKMSNDNETASRRQQLSVCLSVFVFVFFKLTLAAQKCQTVPYAFINNQSVLNANILYHMISYRSLSNRIVCCLEVPHGIVRHHILSVSALHHTISHSII